MTDKIRPPWTPEQDPLTAEEARDLADELGTQLYRAQDALAYVEECCAIADREGRQPTTGDVRQWLKGARCGRQLAADNPHLYRKIVELFGETTRHDDGPSVEECTQADRRWPLEKAGE